MWENSEQNLGEMVHLTEIVVIAGIFVFRQALIGLLAASVVLGPTAAGRGGQPAQSQTSPPQDQQQPQQQPETKPAPQTPIAVKKAELGDGDTWNPAWDAMIERALPRNLLSGRRAAAVGQLCPNYRTMTVANRRAFWAYFFQALAGAEAGLRPTADVLHNDPEVAVIDRVTHRTVRQEGLLQLTYMDNLRYGCSFDWERDEDLPEHDPAKTILQPRNNLLCGIRIVEDQLVKQHKPLLSDSSYWVTLRPDAPSFKMFVRQMANVPEACGSPLHKSKEDEPKLPPASEAEQSKPAGAGKPAAVEVDPHPGTPADPAAGPKADPSSAPH